MSHRARVCLDLTALQPVRSGVDRYLITLVRGLAEARAPSVDLTLLVNRGDRSELEHLAGGRTAVVTASLGGRLGRAIATGVIVPWLTARRRFDVVHSPSFIMPAIRGRARHVVTVFDMTTHCRPELHTRLRRSLLFRITVASSIRRADRVLVPSRHVRARLLDLFPEVDEARVRTVPLGLDPRFSPADTVRQSVAPAAGPFVLFVGTLEPRKNLATLLEAFRQAVEAGGLPHRLVIVGRPGWGTGGSLDAARRRPLRDRVRLAGHVTEDELLELYRRASLFVYPSLEEGFGYPPLEAMACGTPVIAGDTSSLRENLEGAAILVPPEDATALAGAMSRLAADPAEQGRLRAAGLERVRRFSAEETARRTIACYEELSACGAGCRRGR